MYSWSDETLSDHSKWSYHYSALSKRFFSVISRKTLNVGYRDETYVLTNGHEICQNYYDQIIMKLLTL